MEILSSPDGRAYIKNFKKSSKIESKLHDAFQSGNATGLLELVKNSSIRNRSDSCVFWYDYASEFMHSLCELIDTEPLEIKADVYTLENFYSSAMPFKSFENIDLELLHNTWLELNIEVKKQISHSKSSARKFLSDNFPAWEEVGKLHFHLAENKTSKSEPFAFLATYSFHIPNKARVQHRPLGLALKDSIEKKKRKQLEQLIKPIERVAKKSEFFAAAIEKKSIFGPIFLGPKDAYRIISDFPECEKEGIVCKVPNGWKAKQPPRAKFNVSVINHDKKSRVGFKQLMNFKASIAIDGKSVTKAQLKKILNSEDPLVQIGGRWVEVDQDRISRMLEVWDEAISSANIDGVSFSEAMRILSGFSTGDGALAELNDEDEDQDWLEVSAGNDFLKILNQITNPSSDLASSIDRKIQKHLNANLRHYQKSGLSWLASISKLGLGGCLADDMGLGKTIQIISLLTIEKHLHKNTKPSLLVVPASLLGNWKAEIDRFSPSLEYKILHSSALSTDFTKRKPKLINKNDLVITTYGMVLRTAWMQKQDWNLIIADEAQAIKNAKTKQAKALISLKGACKIAMTGTPVENSLSDLWSIFSFCCPGLLKSQTEFKNTMKILKANSEGARTDFSPLRKLISPYILRRKKTDKSVISDLPDKIEVKTICYLTKKQVSLYQKSVDKLEYELENAEGIKRKVLILSYLLKFKQICNHPSHFLGDASYSPRQSGKFEKMKELVETIASRGEKLLVFTQFREMTDIIEHFLSDCFGEKGLIIHGGTTVKKRQGLVEKFQDPAGPPFFVLSLKAGGTGLNLTEASHVIHFDRWWNPAIENQATDRAFRIGQKKNVVVHKFICRGTVEERIDEMISDKSQLAEDILSSTKEVNLTELSNNELLDMVRLDLSSIQMEI